MKKEAKKDSKSLQMNIRMTPELFEKISFLSDALNVETTDWLRIKIAELVSKELNEFQESAASRFVNSYISAHEYEFATGLEPSKELIAKRDKNQEAAKRGFENAQKDLLEAVKKQKGEKV